MSRVLRRSLVLVFVLLALSLIASAHWYIARSLVLEPGLGGPWRSAGLALVFGGFGLLFLQPFAERLLPAERARLLAWPAYLWMGFAFLLLTVLGFSEVVLWLAGSPAAAAGAGADPGAPAAGVRAAVVGFVALVLSGFGLRSGLGPPATRRVTVELERWPRALDGFRIAQISDVHIGPILGRAFAEHVTSRVNELDADLVAVTGDLVDGSVSKLHDDVVPFAGLRGKHGVWFVTGNHDHYSGAKSWVARVEELGMRPLRNDRVEIRVGDAAFDLVGVDDHRGDIVGGGGSEDLDRALAGRDPERAAVLLAHDPSTFKRSSARDIDLQLSGHTHGGQLWPFVFVVRLVVPWVAGLYRVGRAQLYVSRGTGFWGPPMRLLCPAEITEITLRAPQPQPQESSS